MDKKIPTYKIVVSDLDEDQGVNKISLVESPAIEVDWMYFNKEENPYTFKFANEEQKKLAGALLIPDKPIYRFTEADGEFYVVFSKEVIKTIAERYNKNRFHTSWNVEHYKDVEDVYLAENWIVEGDNDKSKNYGFDLPIGSWFGIAKIDNSEVWEQLIKSEDLKGFSVELLSGYTLSKEEETPSDDQVLEWLSDKGEDLESLLSDGWEIEEEEDLFTIASTPSAPSKYDNENYKTRFLYKGGKPIETTRKFCREMVTTYKNKVFRYEDITQMSFNRANGEFGYYSIWKFKGSYNCRHYWQRVLLKRVSAKSTKKPSTPPNYDTARTKTNQLNKFNNMDVTLKDGTILTAEALEVGQVVLLESGDFAPEGQHVLEDERILVVGPEGVIQEIKEAEAEEEAEAPEENQENEMMSTLINRIDALEAEIAELKQNDFKADIAEIKNTLSSIPSETPEEKKPSKISETAKRINNFSNFYKTK